MSIIRDSNEKLSNTKTIKNGFLAIIGFFRPEGSYNETEYNVVSFISLMALLILLRLPGYGLIPGYVPIICIPVYFYINYIITGKRMRGLGRRESKFYKGFIPFWMWFFRENESEKERNKLGDRDYKIKEYNRRHSNRKTRDYYLFINKKEGLKAPLSI